MPPAAPARRREHPPRRAPRRRAPRSRRAPTPTRPAAPTKPRTRRPVARRRRPGVWQSAPSTRTAARSAVRQASARASRRRHRGGDGTRRRRAPAAPARPARRPGRTRARRGARRARRARGGTSPAAGEHERVDLAVAPSLRSRVSTLPRSSTISRSSRHASSWPRAAATRCRPARRRQRRRSRRRPGPRAAGTATISVPSARSPGTSLAECTARSISPSTQRRARWCPPSATCRRVITALPRGRPRCAASRAHRRRARPPSRPARAPARSRASRSAAASTLGGRDDRVERVLERRRLVEAEELAQHVHARVARAAVGLLDAQRRLVQQPLGDASGRPPRRARGRARSDASQRPPFSSSDGRDDRVGVPAQRGDRRHHLERSEPAREGPRSPPRRSPRRATASDAAHVRWRVDDRAACRPRWRA